MMNQKQRELFITEQEGFTNLKQNNLTIKLLNFWIHRISGLNKKNFTLTFLNNTSSLTLRVLKKAFPQRLFLMYFKAIDTVLMK